MQGPVPSGKKEWTYKGWTFIPLASYSVKARVIHAERYRHDPTSEISPVDLGVAWGAMSDQAVVDKCRFSNSGRFLHWRSKAAGFDWDAMGPLMGNMHVIPANESVRDRLLDLVKGSVFSASGYLVQVQRDGMKPWTSSLTRDDTGGGACEIMWVDSIRELQ